MNKFIQIDCSRGRVFKLNYFQYVIDKIKKYDFHGIKIYIEDIIEVDEFEFVGENRGKYSDKQLIEIVKLITDNGLKCYPIVQTLGHCENICSISEYSHLKDTNLVLNVNTSKKYINNYLKKIAQIFGTEFINIGFDETNDLAMGTLYRETKTLDQKKEFFKHLNNTYESCKINGFERVEIWCDMISYLYSSEELYSNNTKFDLEVYNLINPDIELNYWNYWTSEVNELNSQFKLFKDFPNKVNFSSGLNCWFSPMYDSRYMNATKIHYDYCENNKIEEFTFTLWFDDGATGEILSPFDALDYIINKIEINEDDYLNITNSEFDTYSIINDDLTYLKYFSTITNLDKLFEFKNNISKLNIENQIIAIIRDVIVAKIDCYESLVNNNNYSTKVIETLSSCLASYLNLIEEQWYTYCKNEGIERLQYRITGQIYRINNIKQINKPNKLRKSGFNTFSNIAYSNFSRWEN